MKKGVIGLVAVAALGYGAATYYFGGEAESQINKNVRLLDSAIQQQTSHVAGPKFQFTLKDYQKGFLSSSANLKISLDLSDLPTKAPIPLANLSYDLPLKIEHGPIIMSLIKPGLAYITSTASLPEKMVKMDKAQLSDGSTLPELNMNLLVNFDGSSRFDGKVPPFTIQPKALPGKLSWKGMDMYYDLSPEMNAVNGAAVINGLDLDSPFANGKVDKIDMDYDLKAADYGLWTGRSSMTVPAISMSSNGQSLFELNKLKFESSANISNGLMSLALNASMAKAMVKAQTFGPMNFIFEASKFDAKTFAGMQGLLQQLNNAKNLPKEQVQALMLELNKQIPALVVKGAEISVKQFEFKLPKGLISANFHAQVPAGNTAKTALELAQLVKANGMVKLPKEMVKTYLVRKARSVIRQKQMMQQKQ